MARSRGIRRKTRHILQKNFVRGLSYLLHDYKVGDKVVIDIDPSEHKGMPHKRFQGKVGVVNGVGRRTVAVKVNIGNKEKSVTSRLNHVKPIR
ncbi:MAG: 50S ribosomal protein L21 [Nitrososphaerales archaeon]